MSEEMHPAINDPMMLHKIDGLDFRKHTFSGVNCICAPNVTLLRLNDGAVEYKVVNHNHIKVDVGAYILISVLVAVVLFLILLVCGAFG